MDSVQPGARDHNAALVARSAATTAAAVTVAPSTPAARLLPASQTAGRRPLRLCRATQFCSRWSATASCAADDCSWSHRSAVGGSELPMPAGSRLRRRLQHAGAAEMNASPSASAPRGKTAASACAYRIGSMPPRPGASQCTLTTEAGATSTVDLHRATSATPFAQVAGIPSMKRHAQNVHAFCLLSNAANIPLSRPFHWLPP